MGIVLFVIFGLVAGFRARAIMPGRRNMGLLMTAGLGIAGSFVGGFVMSLVTENRVTDFNTAGAIGSVLGAILLPFLAGRFSRRGAAV